MNSDRVFSTDSTPIVPPRKNECYDPLIATNLVLVSGTVAYCCLLLLTVAYLKQRQNCRHHDRFKLSRCL